ncbi:uracil-DNA glycosylase family protein [Adhaeribacter rhizoryzae]|uniref:Uracil-DNA glycosylase-like domain-containing protein n=1 Tax=Adhaeribacter rhizoryzae TaxID=2607907 RepID=A0A5M6DB15_9BACT|nr:uracil-DNA glycosylase family protein [Adhaeribacter rhizoryzae]KAA5542325.1 hypothetical protein F0145_19030 [Adhaeribacter rhizoryzae]
MIKTLLEQKYGQFITNEFLTDKNEVIKENWNKDGVEEQKNVVQTLKSLKDLNGNNLVPDNFWSQPVEWGFDFSSWVGNYDNKEFFIIGVEPHIYKNYQLVYDFGNLKDKTLHESANEHYADKNDIWHYLTNIFVDKPTPDSITEFLNKCYITDLCHVVPKGCGQVNTICEKLSIQPGEWHKFRTAVAKRFLLEEIKAVNPKVVILHGNASREFFQYELGVTYTQVYPIDNSKYTIKVGVLENYKIVSIPHLKGDMKNKLWKCKKYPERPLSAKKILNQIVNQA